jgi:hypothetical protein
MKWLLLKGNRNGASAMFKLLHANNSHIASLAVLIATVCMLANESYAEDVTMSAKPRKAAVLPGEPSVVDAQIQNHGDQPITIDLGYDGIGAFWFEISNGNGDTVATSERIMRFGPSRSGRHTLSPGEATEVPLIMNMWCSTMLPPGEYTVVLNWETIPVADHQVKGRDAFQLTIMPADDEKLSALLEQLKNDALDRESAIASRQFTTQMLLNSQAPAAVNLIREFMAEVRDRGEEQLAIQAIEALGRIETVESIQALTEVALPTDAKKDNELANRAVAMVYQIFDSAADKPAVRQACQDVMQARPRPEPPGTVID